MNISNSIKELREMRAGQIEWLRTQPTESGVAEIMRDQIDALAMGVAALERSLKDGAFIKAEQVERPVLPRGSKPQ